MKKPLYSLVVMSWTKEEYKCEYSPYVEIISISDKLTAYEKFLRFEPEYKDLYIEVSIWESKNSYCYDELDFNLPVNQFMKKYKLTDNDLIYIDTNKRLFEPEYKEVNSYAIIAIFRKLPQGKLELRDITYAYLAGVKTEYDLIDDEHFMRDIIITDATYLQPNTIHEIITTYFNNDNRIINKYYVNSIINDRLNEKSYINFL